MPMLAHCIVTDHMQFCISMLIRSLLVGEIWHRDSWGDLHETGNVALLPF